MSVYLWWSVGTDLRCTVCASVECLCVLWIVRFKSLVLDFDDNCAFVINHDTVMETSISWRTLWCIEEIST